MSLPQNMTTAQYREASENTGTAIRMPATAILTVDTADRLKYDASGYAISPGSVNNLYINTQQTLIQGYFTRLALTELNMVWATPNVNKTNETLTLRLFDGLGGSVDVTADLIEAFYDPASLAITLTNLFNTTYIPLLPAPYPARYPGITFTWSAQGCNFTIQNSIPGNNFLIIPKNIGASDDLTNMMGFGAIPSTITPASTWIGGYATMQYTPYFDIVSRQLTKKQNVKDNSSSSNTGRNLLTRIYISQNDLTPQPIITNDVISPYTDQQATMLGCRPFTIHREFQVPKQIFWDTKEFLNVVDLQLIDYKGNILYESPAIKAGNTVSLGSGLGNWQLTFQITET